MLSRYLQSLTIRPSVDPMLTEPHGSDLRSNQSLEPPSSPVTDTSRPPPSPLLNHSLNDLQSANSRPNPEANSFAYIEALIESLACLGKLNHAVEIIVQRLPGEIYNLVEETVNEVAERFACCLASFRDRKGPKTFFHRHEPLQRSATAGPSLQSTIMARMNTNPSFRPESPVSIMSLTVSQPNTNSSANQLRASPSQQHAHLTSAETLRDLFWTLYSKLDAVLQGFRVSYEVSMQISEVSVSDV